MDTLNISSQLSTQTFGCDMEVCAPFCTDVGQGGLVCAQHSLFFLKVFSGIEVQAWCSVLSNQAYFYGPRREWEVVPHQHTMTIMC